MASLRASMTDKCLQLLSHCDQVGNRDRAMLAAHELVLAHRSNWMHCIGIISIIGQIWLLQVPVTTVRENGARVVGMYWQVFQLIN